MLPHAVLPTQSQQARESSSGVSGPMRKWSRSSYSHGERTDPACRFLPVRVEGRIDVEWLRANARQVIGEAAAREAAGEAFSIPDEVLPEARAQQEAARQESPVEVLLQGWFADKPDDVFIKSVDLLHTACFCVGEQAHGDASNRGCNATGWVLPEGRQNSVDWRCPRMDQIVRGISFRLRAPCAFPGNPECARRKRLTTWGRVASLPDV
jgi:hypothetical protein